MLDIINLNTLEKVSEIELGNSPVGIVIDQKKKKSIRNKP